MNCVWIANSQRHKTSVIPWESVRMLPKGDLMLKHASPPFHHLVWGEAGNRGDVVCDLRDEVASLEEALSQMGTSSKMPFCFRQHGRLPLEWSLLPEHWQTDPECEDGMCYCIQVRVTLGEGGGDQPPHPNAWTSLLIADMFQDGLEEWITKAVVLAPKAGDLIF